MTQLKRMLGLLSLVVWCLINTQAEAANKSRKKYIVQFKKGHEQTVRSFTIKTGRLLSIKESIPELNALVIESPDELTGQKTIQQLLLDPTIQRIEEDVQYHSFLTPNDPDFSKQTALMQINAPEAWDYSIGSKNITIGIIDGGTATGHPDLNGNLYHNPHEIPSNAQDDDGNGLIDDVQGWSFLNNSNNIEDEGGHGTHIAGILGATSNNQKQITGINWNTSLLSVQSLDKKGTGSLSNLSRGIVYAVNQGARIINLSWGGPTASAFLQDAIIYATQKGALIVAAAGNETTNLDLKPIYPAAYSIPGLLSVASNDLAGKRSKFTNYGSTTVHLAAPGNKIVSTFLNGTTAIQSGTSMAAPFVAGVAALVLAYRPELSVVDLQNAVLNATHQQIAYKDFYATEGDLDAGLALRQFNQGQQIWPRLIRLRSGSQFQFSFYDGNNIDSSAVSFVSKNPDILSISEQGNAHVLSEGMAQIVAQNAQGTILAQATVYGGKGNPVIPPDSSTGGGCLKAKNHLSLADSSSATFSFLIPILVGAIGTRKPRRQKRS